MHAFALSFRSVFFASIEQSHQQSFEPARKPPPDAYRPTAAPAIGRDETPSRRVQKTPRLAPPRPPVSPSQSMSAARWPARVPPLCPRVYPPPCVYPGYTHTPSTPLSTVQDPSIGTRPRPTRGGKSASPPHHTKNKKKRKEPPSPLTNAKINTHGVGRRRIQPTRGSVRSPRAPACAMDNDRCHVSGPCGSCVPSTRTGHDSRKNDTPTTDRAYASASSSSSPFPLVRSTSRVVSARRTCTFDSLDASNALDRHPSHRRLADSARALRRRARARRGRKPRASTDATDRPPRRPRPTTTTDDESIRTQGRRYGTRARLDAIDRPEARACRRVRAFAASASSTTTATEVNTASCRCDTRLFEK